MERPTTPKPTISPIWLFMPPATAAQLPSAAPFNFFTPQPQSPATPIARVLCGYRAPPTGSQPFGLLRHHRMPLSFAGSWQKRHGSTPDSFLTLGHFVPLPFSSSSVANLAWSKLPNLSQTTNPTTKLRSTREANSFSYRRLQAEFIVGTDQPATSAPGPFTSPLAPTPTPSHHSIPPQPMAVRPRPHDARSRNSPTRISTTTHTSRA